ncbi:unnamed protein product, partial [Medioppia subpectinata]
CAVCRPCDVRICPACTDDNRPPAVSAPGVGIVAGDIDKATDEVTLTEVRDEKDRICDGNYCKIHKGHHVTFELTFKP